MKIIFDWCNSFYEEKKDWRGDAEIISLEISHQECSFASAKAVIYNKKNDFCMLNDKKYAKIGVKFEEDESVKLLFTGRLVSFPIGFGNSFLKLEFISEPNDFQDQLKNFRDKNLLEYEKNNIAFDDLFFSEKDISENPSVFLEGNTKCFFWDMRSGKLALSDINHSEKNIDLTCDQILKDSFRVKLAREPYRNVRISVSAEWIQHLRGYLDVIPIIARKFKGEIINSFTNLKTGLENLFSNQNGYNLIDYKINEVAPSLGMPPSKEIEIEKKSIKLHRFYFKGFMVINWHLKQKRIETVTANIINSQIGREKNIHIKLNAIQLQKEYMHWRPLCNFKTSDKVIHSGFIFECILDHISSFSFEEKNWKKINKIPDALQDDSCNSFFCTPRGRKAIKYAMQKAIALINYSSRYIEMTFTVDAKDFMFVSLNDQITITDPRFKNGKITGKVMKTTFTGNDKHKIIQITIGCRSSEYKNNIAEQLEKYFSELKIEETKTHINADNIIMDINVLNPPEEQDYILSKEPINSIADIKSKLSQHKTKIRMKLHPLNTCKSISKNIELPDFKIQ